MKHTDLQIGDYVYHKDKIVKVDVLTPSDLNLAVADENGSDGALYKDIKPIPITPEIIKNNNLEKRYMSGRDYYIYNWCGCYKGRLRYVHELQHALRLCGIEKEIEL